MELIEFKIGDRVSLVNGELDGIIKGIIPGGLIKVLWTNWNTPINYYASVLKLISSPSDTVAERIKIIHSRQKKPYLTKEHTA